MLNKRVEEDKQSAEEDDGDENITLEPTTGDIRKAIARHGK